MPKIIETHEISRMYKMGTNIVNALQSISIVIDRGEYVAFMGPSGSGKSTLMNIVGCLDHPTHGSYLLDGIDVVDKNPRVSAFQPAIDASCFDRSCDFVGRGWVDTAIEHIPSDRAIHGPGIDVNKAEPSGELARDAALARGGGTIDGNNTMSIILRSILHGREQRRIFSRELRGKQAR